MISLSPDTALSLLIITVRSTLTRVLHTKKRGKKELYSEVRGLIVNVVVFHSIT